MPATAESTARTRSFARVIGPFLVIVPGIIIARGLGIEPILRAFFGNEALVWFVGALLLVSGLVIVAFHQYWSSATQILISLFGWFLAIRGLLLLAAPDMVARGAYAAMGHLPVVRIGFSLLVLLGLWLMWIGWFKKE